jgi:hypothetical protein
VFKIIFTIVFTYFFAKFMSIFFSEEYSGFTKKSQVIYVVKPKQGAVACATEEIYKNVQNLYLKDDLKLIEAEIKSKNCMLLESGEELEAYEGICDVADENSVKLFKSKKVFLQKIYVPCFAVEMKKIIEETEEEIDEQIKKSQDTIELNDTKQKLSAPEIENKKIEPKNIDQQNVNLPKIN